MKPLCFVLMPFGIKVAPSGLSINFDAVYKELIYPAIEKADLEPLRADEEMSGGIIHKPMFERLILCEFAVADLTSANANVFYELGLRHAVRPASTILLFALGSGQLPFDVAMLRALPYTLNADGRPVNVAVEKELLFLKLKEARNNLPDSPIFQLVEGFPDIQRLKTDVFRDRVDYSKKIKLKLQKARTKGADSILEVEKEIDSIQDAETGVIIDLFLSYRFAKAWNNMINLVEKMSPPLSTTILVQEQLGLALNRAGRSDEAERVLVELINNKGPSSETYGILGRVYKDRWEEAVKKGENVLANGLLNKAINAYMKGFETDWRDAYPGVNAITLMELKEPPDPLRKKLIPVVTYSAERRIAAGKPDYWDYATLLELSVIARNQEEAMIWLSNSLANFRENWELETTARNIRLIREANERRNKPINWISEIENALLQG